MITCYLAVSIVVIWCIYHYLLLQYNSIDAWHFLSPFFNVNVHCTANFRSHTPQTQVSRILCSECMKKCWFEANNVLEGKVYWTELKSKREMVQKTGGRLVRIVFVESCDCMEWLMLWYRGLVVFGSIESILLSDI